MIGQRAIALRILAGLLIVTAVTACSGTAEAPVPTLQLVAPAPTDAAPTAAPTPRPAATTTPTATADGTTSATPISKPTANPAATTGASPAPTHETGDPNAMTGRIVLADQGFAITLPTGWRRVPLDGSAIGDLSTVLPADSELGRMLASQVGRAAMAGIKLWAFDLRPASVKAGYASNVNAAVQPPTKAFGLPAFKEFLVAQLDSVAGISGVDSAIITVPSGQVIRTTYRISMPLSTGKVKIAGTQFIALGPSHTYAITFSCAVDDEACTSAADATMQTFAYVS